jgi:protein-L-isoaspartate(D-aspartate) O-methyltransferase
MRTGAALRKDLHVRDAVALAMAAVDAQQYMLEPDGAQLPQTTRPQLIARVLRMLEALPGQRVLEVGTGSGYSTALLSHIVGDEGDIVSLDVDPAMTSRAERLLSGARRSNVQVLYADGQFGHAAGAPYDRLAAWAAAKAIPPLWVEQVRPGGIIVAPLVRPQPVVVRLKVLPHGQTVEEAVIHAGFIPLTPEPYRPWETSKYGRPQPPGRRA